ncbi:AraC family transcriptional regulator [Streptomyces diastatochromogenes]|nr:AraC family transcriptional regulator [Streptomyces diastatochromogenes]
MSAVAQRWGFVSPAHFSRSFRAAYGVSPVSGATCAPPGRTSGSPAVASAPGTAPVSGAPAGTGRPRAGRRVRSRSGRPVPAGGSARRGARAPHRPSLRPLPAGDPV